MKAGSLRLIYLTGDAQHRLGLSAKFHHKVGLGYAHK